MEPHHHHEHSHRLTSLNKAFIIGIALNITFVIVEFGVGFYYNSLGLLSDAGHNLGDVASLVLAMLAFRLEKVHPKSRYTYGYKKSTILVSLLNAVILLIAVGIIIAESIDKLFHPVSVDGSAIAWTAGVGVVINALTAFLLFFPFPDCRIRVYAGKNKNQRIISRCVGSYFHCPSFRAFWCYHS